MVREEESFLQDVTEKIKKRIEKIDQTLLTGQKEIENMHDYYWENYTEMDQYGYEDYDNQQALLSQVNANQEAAKQKQRFLKMLDSPYFGRVDFVYSGETEKEPFYIGIGNFAEEAGSIPLIYDWRAPVAGLFYDYDKGEASYEAPAGVMTGEIISKWQYKIRNGRMIYAFESDTKIDDDILKEELGSSSDVQLKNIVRTIQKEQNAIIRNQRDKILVIQGAAGSGKTSVALHRAAYLLYHDRKNLKASDILILSPNSVFADYISHILPELGEENIQEMSFDLFAYRELRGITDDCEDRYHHLERMMKYPDAEQSRRFQKKQSSEFIGEMEGFLAILEDRLMDFREVSFRGIKKTEEELIRLFYFKFQDLPLLARMDAVREYAVDEYETLYGKELTEEEAEAVKAQFDRSYVTKDIYQIYSWFLEDNGYPPLPDISLGQRMTEYEDVYGLLYLKYRLLGRGKHRRIKHLIIDEMQDYSYLQYVILDMLFDCKMTILGDKAQTLDETVHDVCTFLPGIFGKKMRKITMNKSYRNTVQIASYAAKFSADPDVELLERQGKEVEVRQFQKEDDLLEAILEAVRAGEERFETAAVLTRTEAEAEDIYHIWKSKGVQVSYIDRNSTSFRKGLTVTTFYMAKGLEFDQVFAVKDRKETPLDNQAAYISATRALHELYVFSLC